MSTLPLQRNRGAVMLSRTGKTQEEIAGETGVSRALVSHWIVGRRVPVRLEDRSALRDRYKIPVEAWDQEPETIVPTRRTRGRPPKVASPPPVDEWGTGPVQARAARLGKIVDSLLEKAEDESLSPGEQAKLAQRAGFALGQLGRITGETLLIDEARLVRMPALRRVFDAMVRTLTPWPEAMRAVGEELRRIGAS